MSDCDIEFLLREWAKWSRGGLGGCAASSSIWGGGSGVAPDISDDQALRLDSAIVALGVNHPVLRDVIEMAYLRGWGVFDISVRMHVGRHKVDKYLSEAKGFISGFITVSSKAA